MDNKIIKLERNFMFVDIFNQEYNVPKLEYFISVYFNFPYEKVHNNLSLLPRKLTKDNKEEAWKEVDLLLKLDNELLKINIEINDKNLASVINRNVIYLSKIASTNYKEGDKKYKEIWTTRQINFNVHDNKNEKLINEYLFKEKESNEILSNIVQIDVINIAKVDELCYNELDEREKVVYDFCKMLMAETKEEFEEASEKIMDKELSEDLAAQMDRKSREDEYVYMESTYSSADEYWADVVKEGLKEGLKEREKEILNEGKEKGKLEGSKLKQEEIAKNLLKDKMDINLIQKYTGLTQQEIENLK